MEILIYSYFYSMNQSELAITVSNNYLAELFNKDERTIKRTLNRLEKKEWISKIHTKKGRIICINYLPIEQEID